MHYDRIINANTKNSNSELSSFILTYDELYQKNNYRYVGYDGLMTTTIYLNSKK